MNKYYLNLLTFIAEFIVNNTLYPIKKIQKDYDYCKSKLYKIENRLLKTLSDRKISKENYEKIINEWNFLIPSS